jgi:hypothetical protein
MIIASGFLPYHIELKIQSVMASHVQEQLRSLQKAFREKELSSPSDMAEIEDYLASIKGVDSVVLEGPQSSSLIPLRMFKAANPTTEAKLCTTIGAGTIANAIREALDSMDICLCGKELPSGDSPLECSLRDENGNALSIKIYPASRTKFKQPFKEDLSNCSHVIVNRINKGLINAMRTVHGNGGLASMRLHSFDRYTKPIDAIEVFPYANHIILSTRNKVLKSVASAMGCPVEDQWDTDTIPTLRKLSKQISSHSNTDKLIVFNHYETGANLFCFGAKNSELISAPENYDPASRASRIQGAALLLAEALSEHPEATFQKIVTMAYRGTEQRPWKYV